MAESVLDQEIPLTQVAKVATMFESDESDFDSNQVFKKFFVRNICSIACFCISKKFLYKICIPVNIFKFNMFNNMFKVSNMFPNDCDVSDFESEPEPKRIRTESELCTKSSRCSFHEAELL
jgi:hypothetical protein